MFCRPVVFLLHFQDILSEMGVTTKTGCCFDLVGGGGGLEVLASTFSPNTFCLIQKSQEQNMFSGR